MAEALFKITAPPAFPWRAASAGLSAIDGAEASYGAREAIRECGGNLDIHSSRRVSPAMLADADLIVAMNQFQMERLNHMRPDIRDKLFKLRMFERPKPHPVPDLPDPYGGTLADYRQCRDIIRKAMPGLIRFLQTRDLPFHA